MMFIMIGIINIMCEQLRFCIGTLSYYNTRISVYTR